MRMSAVGLALPTGGEEGGGRGELPEVLKITLSIVGMHFLSSVFKDNCVIEVRTDTS